ncbi:MAG: MTH1187 family thiamine-binding protein [ANME-2 cluster archaeon]|nr:MTH1187 family thiamine-binding protein [ANME-2 cluster archaeon]
MTGNIVTAQLQIAVLGECDDSLSRYISTAVKALDDKNVQYQVCPMGTAIQAESIGEILDACKAAHEAVLDMGVNRILTNIIIDHRVHGCKGLDAKVRSVTLKL